MDKQTVAPHEDNEMMETEDQVQKEMQEEFRKRLQSRLQERAHAREQGLSITHGLKKKEKSSCI